MAPISQQYSVHTLWSTFFFFFSLVEVISLILTLDSEFVDMHVGFSGHVTPDLSMQFGFITSLHFWQLLFFMLSLSTLSELFEASAGPNPTSSTAAGSLQNTPGFES